MINNIEKVSDSRENSKRYYAVASCELGPNNLKRILGGVSECPMSDEIFKQWRDNARVLGFSAIERITLVEGQLVEKMDPPIEAMNIYERAIKFRPTLHGCG
jgi:hypothetical protein